MPKLVFFGMQPNHLATLFESKSAKHWDGVNFFSPPQDPAKKKKPGRGKSLRN
jgi:hypothetical protein